MLEAHVVKRRRDLTIDVSLRVGSGESLALIGPSGAGKSTVLNCIAGFDQPDSGSIVVDGETFSSPNLPLGRRNIGYLAQSADLFPHMSVRDNVAFGLRRGTIEAAAWVSELRDKLELTRIWRAPAAKISGGQARRVALARMLARRPRLVLLDEPFAGADRDVVRALVAMLAYWQMSIGFSIVIVDHDLDVLTRVTQRAIAIEHGMVVQSGTWSEIRATPATATLESLLAPL
jgi:ABC-type sulfate/molybdate transport systems ATPase subunit